VRGFESQLGRWQREIGRTLTGGREVALLDPRPLLDPLVVGVHHPREIVVRVRTPWCVVARTDDAETGHGDAEGASLLPPRAHDQQEAHQNGGRAPTAR